MHTEATDVVRIFKNIPLLTHIKHPHTHTHTMIWFWNSCLYTDNLNLENGMVIPKIQPL